MISSRVQDVRGALAAIASCSAAGSELVGDGATAAGEEAEAAGLGMLLCTVP